MKQISQGDLIIKLKQQPILQFKISKGSIGKEFFLILQKYNYPILSINFPRMPNIKIQAHRNPNLQTNGNQPTNLFFSWSFTNKNGRWRLP